MDQCDSKINLVKYMWVSDLYISWSIDFALYHCHRLKLFLHIKKWRRPGVFVPLQALALVSICFDVLKRSVLKHRYNYAKGYMEIEFLWPPFCFKKDKTTAY